MLNPLLAPRSVIEVETMRAYLRLDPNLPDRKNAYPDGAYRAYIEALCFAEQQPKRGRFRNAKLLAVLLEKRAKWIPYLISHGDLVKTEGGLLYLDGWDEWQEGDVTVSERMKRLRSRRRDVTPTDTPTVTPATVTVPSERLAVGGGGKPKAETGDRNNGRPTFMGWNGAGLHDGRHGEDCAVCAPLLVKGAPPR